MESSTLLIFFLLTYITMIKVLLLFYKNIYLPLYYILQCTVYLFFLLIICGVGPGTQRPRPAS